MDHNINKTMISHVMDPQQNIVSTASKNKSVRCPNHSCHGYTQLLCVARRQANLHKTASIATGMAIQIHAILLNDCLPPLLPETNEIVIL